MPASPEDHRPGPPERPATLLILPALLLPVAPENRTLAGVGVAVRDGAIVELGSAEELAARHPQAARLRLDEHLLLPGLVNCHGHMAMTLLRGVGESQPLDAWLNETIWPLEERLVTADFVRDGTRLAIAEMVAAGTTSAADMYYFPEVGAQACREAGFRLQSAFPIIEVANAYSKDADECFSKGLALHDRFRSEPLVTVCFGPHSPYTVQQKSLERVAMLADELNADVHMHLHETEAEVAAARKALGKSWIGALDDMGLFNESLQAVHMTTLSDAEVELAAERGVRVVHCPHSNMKLASGVCPVARLRAADIAVGIGTDGAASNNGLDSLAEARLAVLLAKSAGADAAALPARDALEMATLGGARTLGIDHLVGSIEPGKRADLVAVDLRHPSMQPLHDAHAQLLHTGAGGRVTHTFIDGRLVYDNGVWPTLDIEQVLEHAERWRLRAS